MFGPPLKFNGLWNDFLNFFTVLLNQSRNTPANVKRELDPSGGVTGSFLGAPDPCTGESGPVFGLTVCFTWGTVRATCPLHGQPGLSTSVSTEVPGDPAPNPRPQLPPGQAPHLPRLVPLRLCPAEPPVYARRVSTPVAFTFSDVSWPLDFI